MLLRKTVELSPPRLTDSARNAATTRHRQWLQTVSRRICSHLELLEVVQRLLLGLEVLILMYSLRSQVVNTRKPTSQLQNSLRTLKGRGNPDLESRDISKEKTKKVE